MTVLELIAALHGLPPDAEVYVENTAGSGDARATGVRIGSYYSNTVALTYEYYDDAAAYDR